MIWPARIFAMALCAEWLIILRMWMAPHVLFLTIGLAAARYYALYFLPHIGLIAVIFFPAIIATAWRLRALWRGTSGASRQVNETPDTGVPWLMLIARNERLTALLELVLVAVTVTWISNTGVVFYPNTTPDWLLAHGALFANLTLWVQPIGIILWNVQDLPRITRERATPAPRFTYSRVVKPERAPVPLPGVKELSDGLG